MVLTENFQQSLTALAVNCTVNTKLMSTVKLIVNSIAINFFSKTADPFRKLTLPLMFENLCFVNNTLPSPTEIMSLQIGHCWF